MLTTLIDLVRPMLFAVPPEDAHELTLKSLEMGFYPRKTGPDDPLLAVDLWGLEFANPLGIAAGFDKDARVADAVLGMGCGFAEVGTTTPLAQPGNPSPRVFRLVADRGVINRLGFNNGGHEAALARLETRAARGIVGVNLGANKDARDRAADYVLGLETFYDVASYFTVNISSPNTPGLRDLQAPAALGELLSRVMAARAALIETGKPKRPVVVKIAPDIAEDDIGPLTERLVAHGVDGIAVSNTTLSRDGLTDANAREAGGLSGRPLFHRSTVMLAKIYEASGGRVPLIGIGGIDSGEAALAKIEAGATLLQLYTGLIYEGPGLIARIKERLATDARRRSVGLDRRAHRGALKGVGGQAADVKMKFPLTLYHNPRCSNSRAALELLEDRGLAPKIVLYLETPPTALEIKDLLRKLETEPRQLMRTKEAIYKELGLGDPDLSDALLVRAMVENPILIERPILVSGSRAVIGRPPERVLEIV